MRVHIEPPWRVAVVAVLAVLPFWGCGAKQALLAHAASKISGATMGTTYALTLPLHELPVDGAAAERRLRLVVEDELESVNKAMSTWRDDSELSQFNRHEASTPFPISRETAEVMALAQRVSEESGGAFDVTVGPLVNAWGFGPDKRDGTPSDAELEVLRGCVGYEKVEIDLDAPTLRKMKAEVYCDLSAIAKGYAVDKVAEALGAEGHADYMIEVGGEVRTKGVSPTGNAWRIAIEKPDAAGRSIHRVILLSGLAMATSGDYRNYYESENGQRISHTIDPRTGRPISHTLASVTVLDEQCAMADAYATALNVLGPEDGMALAEKLGLPALFLVRAGPGKFAERESTAFTKYVQTCDNTGEDG